MTLLSISSIRSVDRAAARYLGGHGFHSCWGRIFFFVPHSSCPSIHLSQIKTKRKIRNKCYYPSQTSVDKCFFRLASGTVGFSPRLKNSGHVITFLRRCGLQNTDHVMPFWLWTACLIFPPLSKSRGRKDVLCTIL